MVMDYIDGSDLAKHSKAEALSVVQAASIVADVADAIQHAHERGVIHRDLKPGNVLIDRQSAVYVTDFGFAWLQSDLNRSEQAVVGTAGFMAPEQIDPSCGEIGPHTDVYGLGALLFMLLEGNPPSTESATYETVGGISSASIGNSPCMVKPHPESGLISICQKCLAKDWQQRFSTAKEVSDALKGWLKAI
jgi:serine/threonine protein kinase